jgi:hypothetical protein
MIVPGAGRLALDKSLAAHRSKPGRDGKRVIRGEGACGNTFENQTAGA